MGTERRARAVAVLAAVVVLMGACSPSDPDDENDNTGSTGATAATGASGEVGGTVTIGASSELASPDPHGANGQSFWAVLMNFGNISEGLVTLDGLSNEVKPVLAESWETPDEQTLILHIKEGVTFHDGESLNADVVAQNIERVRNPDTASAIVDFFSLVDNVEVVDEYTVEIHTSAPDPTLLRKLWGLMILSPNDLGSTDDLGTEYSGTGPYMWKEATTDTLTVVQNPDYWGEVSGPSTVVITAMPEAASRIAALQAEEIDIAWDVPPESVETVPNVVSMPALDMVNWRMNSLGGLTEDPRVREAIVIAVDEEEIRLALFGDDFSDPVEGQPVSEGIFGYNPEISERPNDPDAARALLEEAGVVGETVEIVTTDRYPGSVAYTEALAQQLQEVGLEVEVDVRDIQGWLDVLYAQEGSEVEMVLNGAGSEIWDAGITLQKTASGGSPINEFPHDDFPEFQQLLDQANSETDEAARETLLQQALQVWHDADAYVAGYIYHSIWGSLANVEWVARRDARIDFATITT